RGVTRSAAYLFLLPVVTGIFSAWLIGERFGPLQIAGAALVLGVTALVRLICMRAARRATAVRIVAAAETAELAEATATRS
ncbi:MAG: hypothetical protein IT337_15270, partial [Thermomicrobiales bacterium]|nr:hypothetical protein [Thermomicrobiales bacterium]